MNKSLIVVIGIVIIIGGGFWFASSKNFFRAETKTYKIGVIYKGANFKVVSDGFIDGLKANIPVGSKVEYLIKDVAGIEQKDFDAVAQDFVTQKVDLFLAIGVEAVKAAQAVTTVNKIPVILELGINPVAGGFVKNFQKPGDNITGITWQVDELTGKRLELLKTIDPRIKRITVFRTKDTPTMETALGIIDEVSKNLGITYTVKRFATVEELQKVVSETTSKDTDAIFYASDPFFQRNNIFVNNHAIEQKIPVFWHDENLVRSGGLASYGANFIDAGKQGATLAVKILFKKISPADIPVEAASKVDLALNLTTAKAIGLNIPSDVLSLAQVIVN